jgi:aldehyde dehydrogenase (NAD+)
METLRTIQTAVVDFTEKFESAAWKDLARNKFDARIEINVVLGTLDHTIANLKSWMKPIDVDAPLACAPCKSRLHHDPLGVVCVLGAWNFPMFTVMEPIISAVAAGNCCVVKPSEKSVNSSQCISDMIEERLDPKFFRALQGDHVVGGELCSMKFDLIAFTGGSEIGKKVAEAAARNLVPCVLELGGKNPCVVDRTADIDYAAKKITNGRFTNFG